jgi:hypothetical protein
MGLLGSFQAPEIMREPAPSAPNPQVHGVVGQTFRAWAGGAGRLAVVGAVGWRGGAGR